MMLSCDNARAQPWSAVKSALSPLDDRHLKPTHGASLAGTGLTALRGLKCNFDCSNVGRIVGKPAAADSSFFGNKPQ